MAPLLGLIALARLTERQVNHVMGSDEIASAYFVEAPGSSEQGNAKWLDVVQCGNFTSHHWAGPAGSDV